MNLVQWLEKLGCTDVAPVTMTIGKATWKGAIYTKKHKKCYYLIGDRPASHKRGKICYTIEGDDKDWYVACYLENLENLIDYQEKYHPFGANWILKRWDVDGSIDEYMNRPYKRMVAKVSDG